MHTIFAFFGLWGATIAVGAAALTVPVIIHLLNRRRYRVVVWAAMRFLLQAQKQNTRRMRLEQLILLALRMLLILLLILAMASVMPWAENIWSSIWPDGAGFVTVRSGRTHKIIVLDASLSMNVRRDKNTTAFERGRTMAAKLIRDSQAGDGFSVVLMKDFPEWLGLETTQHARQVADDVESLRAAHGNASVNTTLNMILAKLSETASRYQRHEVYFFTDLQKATWRTEFGETKDKDGSDTGGKSWEDVRKKAQIVFVDTGRDEVGNLAVTDIRLNKPFATVGTTIGVIAQLKNFGAKAMPKVKVELLIGRAQSIGNDPAFALQPKQQQLTELSAGEQTTVSFAHRFKTPGVYAVQIRVQEDDLIWDNSRTLIIQVKEIIPILLVNGKSAIREGDRATYFLNRALAPFPKNEEPKDRPIRTLSVSDLDFRGMKTRDLEQYDCIFICDMGEIDDKELGLLDYHVRRGGGLVVSTGDNTANHLGVFNKYLFRNGQGLLPAQLISKVKAPKHRHFGLQADALSYAMPPLKPFADAQFGFSLGTPRFQQFIKVEKLPTNKARTIMSFVLQAKEGGDKDKKVDDGEKPAVESAPAFIEWNPALPPQRPIEGKRRLPPMRYQGKVVLIATTLNMDWNSWPVAPSYIPMMHELVKFAVSGRLGAHSAIVGDVLEKILAGGEELDATLQYPVAINLPPVKQRTKNQNNANGPNVFRFLGTDYSGVYTLTIQGSPQQYLFAVNTPIATPEHNANESDLARFKSSEIKTLFKGQVVTALNQVRLTHQNAEGDVEIVRGKVGPVLAHYALLIVLLLLFLEVILAWLFGHYTSTGSLEQPATARTWPMVVAVLACVSFAAIAGTLAHAAYSGDFLGFLPTGFRGWIEGIFDIPPPAPGEDARWKLEFNPYFSDLTTDGWLTTGIGLAAILTVFFVYRAEAPGSSVAYKCLLGGMRLFLIFLALAVLLPQLQLRFDRLGWPHLIVLIDDSQSMGESDNYQDAKEKKAAKMLAQKARKHVETTLDAQIQSLTKSLAEKRKVLQTNPSIVLESEIEYLDKKLQRMNKQMGQLKSDNWIPTRLQLAQALFTQKSKDWLHEMLFTRRMKLHIFHLDAEGRAIRLTDGSGPAGDITTPDEKLLPRAQKAIARLQPEATDSRLGGALNQVLKYYRGSSIAAVVMLTDGITTRGPTIDNVSEFAAQKGVPLFFVGIGDDHDIRDLKLHDLVVEDTVYVNDRVVFEVLLTGRGYKNLTVPVVLKYARKDGSEQEVARELVKVDPKGNPVKVILRHQPTKVGRWKYIVELIPPEFADDEKAPPPGYTRLEREIDVLKNKTIKVLYVDGEPRYDYRFLKSMLTREGAKKRAVELKTLLLSADRRFGEIDKTALSDFPANQKELNEYDVILFGDCDPNHDKLGRQRLQMIADFVTGKNRKGAKEKKRGGGLLFIAGSQHNPHSYADTPLADVMPVIPIGQAPKPGPITTKYRPTLTNVGRQHPIFRFSPNDGQNLTIWNSLESLFWYAKNYRLKPLAEVLAEHPTDKAAFQKGGERPPHPLVVQQFVGSGRCMFLGFDESWRWRFRDKEFRFNQFWIQTIRYLSRNRQTRTTLRLDRQTPYRRGEPIAVTVKFPDNSPTPGAKKDDPNVEVIVEYRSKSAEKGDIETQVMKLKKVDGSWATFDGLLKQTPVGKYRFWLSNPDMSHESPTGQRPSAEAVVEIPPGELDRLRMNREVMTDAAENTGGRFYTIQNADELLDGLPPGFRVSLNTPSPPWRLWNHWLCFLLIIGLLTAEWLLRKRKHLL